jgi:hypothetical protein
MSKGVQTGIYIALIGVMLFAIGTMLRMLVG